MSRDSENGRDDAESAADTSGPSGDGEKSAAFTGAAEAPQDRQASYAERQGSLRNELLSSETGGRGEAVLRFGLVVLALMLVGLLVWAL